MKKILLATTALVATAGVAAADITFSGLGRFGILYNEGATEETRLEQRFRLTVNGTAETDAGVKFEGRIRFQTDDQADGTSTIANRSAAGFAVSTGGFRLDVGQVSNVADSGDVTNNAGYSVGLTGFGETDSGWVGVKSGFGTVADGTSVDPTIKLKYAVNNFTVSASYEDTVDERTQLGFGYDFGNYQAGILFGTSDGAEGDHWRASVEGDIGQFGFTVLVGDSDAQDDVSYGISLGYEIGAATDLRLAYSNTGQDADDDVIAIGARHNLGGGVSLRGGVGQATSGNMVADFGVTFDF